MKGFSWSKQGAARYNLPMPRTVRSKAIAPARPNRPAHRPTRFTPELGEKICELVACGWLMKEAARHFGIAPETVCRWVVKHEAFRGAYAVARVQLTEIWAEEMIEFADDASRDYTTDKHGNRVFNSENVHRARLRIDARKWQMARLNPRLWGDRQQVDLKTDCSHMTEAARLQKVHELIGLVEDIKRGPEMPPSLEYRREEAEEEPPSGIGGRLRRSV